MVFPVCYSGKHFLNSSPVNQHCFENRTRKVFKTLEHLPLGGSIIEMNNLNQDQMASFNAK